MSRGAGKLQRSIVEMLEANPGAMPDSVEIACHVFGGNECTDSQWVSTRRALRSLAAKGVIVDMKRHWRDGRRRWALPACATEYNAKVDALFGGRRT